MTARADVVTARQVREADRVEHLAVRRRLLERDEPVLHRALRVPELPEHVREGHPRAEMLRGELQRREIRVPRRLHLADLVHRLPEVIEGVVILRVTVQNLSKLLERLLVTLLVQELRCFLDCGPSFGVAIHRFRLL